MNVDAARPIANAVLYEGYLLYPYRTSSVKNRHRWTLGSLFPQAWSLSQTGTDAAAFGAPDAWANRTECMVTGDAPRLEARLRFLHTLIRDDGGADEATEREICIPDFTAGASFEVPFEVSGETASGTSVPRRCERLVGCVRVDSRAIETTATPAYHVRITVENTTPVEVIGEAGRRAAERRSLASPHVLLGVSGGAFVSLLDPPPELTDPALACRNVGTWPVLIGAPGDASTMLSSPIILEDYPRIAPESPGDLFDATEIDEILTLRILTLTDDEKEQMRRDPRGRALLERTLALGPSELARLHGALRRPDLAELPRPLVARAGRSELRAGDAVVLRPRPRGDVLDLVLAGKRATVVSIEQELEGRVYVAVTVDDDPGKDLGLEGKPGHRFFFDVDEVEPAAPARASEGAGPS